MRDAMTISVVMWVLLASMAIGAAEPVVLNGVVSGPDGAIEGAVVNVYMPSFQMEAGNYDIHYVGQTASDADGRFSLSVTPPPSAGYQLTMLFAEKEGLSVGFAYVMRPGAIRLELTAPQTLSGRVEDARGAAVAGAFVQLPVVSVPVGELTPAMTQIPMAMGAEPVPYFTGRTDAEGRFAFTNLPENCTADLMVKKPGLGTFQSMTGMGGAQTARTYTVGQPDIVVTMPDPCTLSGVVIDPDGNPVASVKVLLRDPGSPFPMTYAPLQTDADGVFTFTDVAPGTLSLSVVDTDWISETVTVDVRSDMGVRVRVSKGTLLTVTVIDGVTEEPIEGAQVHVIQENVIPISGITESDGTFQKRLALGTYQLHAYASGYRGRQPETVEITDKPVAVTISFGASAKIAGTVVGPDGAPVAGVEVFVLPEHSQRKPMTDDKGAFVLGWEPQQHRWTQGEFFILAIHRDKNLAVAERINEDTTEIRLTLRPGLTVSGKVAGPDGEPIAGANVSVQFSGSNWSTSMTQQHKTDAEGVYSIAALPPEQRYSVYVAGASGYGTGSANLVVPSEERDIAMPAITLKPADVSVRGTVVDEDDNPLEGVQLHCSGQGQPSLQVQSGKDGTFVFEAVCEGFLQIHARHRAGNQHLSGNAHTEGGAEDVVIVLRAPGSRGVRRPPSLVGKPLPELSDYGLALADAPSPTLVCLWEWRQRPSRYAVRQLAEQADALAERSVRVVLLNAEPTEREPLEAWLSEFGIPFDCGVIEDNPEKTRFALGARGLPWLILTDAEGTVTAEGFDVSELTATLEGM